MRREWQQREMMLHLRMKEHGLRQKAIFWSLNLQEPRRVTAPGADRGMETRTLPRAPPTRAQNGPASRGPRTLRRPRPPRRAAPRVPAARQLTPLLSGLRRAGRGGHISRRDAGGTAGACLQQSPHLWRGEAFRPSPERPSSLRPAWGRGRAPHGRAPLLGDTAPGAKALSPVISAVPTASRGRPGRTGDTRRRAGSGTTCGRGKPGRRGRRDTRGARPDAAPTRRSAGASRLRFPDTRVSLRTR